MRIRLIPIAVFVAALLFTVKAGELWQSLSGVDGAAVRDAVQVAEVSAQDSNESAEGAGAPDEPAPMMQDGADDTYGNGRDGIEPEIDESLLGNTNGGGLRPVERRLENDLAERRQILNARERQMDEREALIAAAEQKLLKKQQQLERLRDRIEELIKQFDAEEEAESKKLVAIYSNMKSKSAAQIFNDLDLETVIQVARGMTARKLAPILADMNPDKARLVTEELNAREELPDLPN